MLDSHLLRYIGLNARMETAIARPGTVGQPRALFVRTLTRDYPGHYLICITSYDLLVAQRIGMNRARGCPYMVITGLPSRLDTRLSTSLESDPVTVGREDP